MPVTGYGLVFKYDDEVWLSRYDASGITQNANPISDDKGIYDSLNDDQFALVEWSENDDGLVWLHDLGSLTINEAIATIVETGDLGMVGGAIYEKVVKTGEYRNPS